MGFWAPLMLLGLAGVAIPLVIHLIGKRRARVIRFAAVDFLLGTDRKVSRWLELRERLLLIARILVCIAIPLAFAQPFLRCDAQGLPATRGPQAAVLILDNSAISQFEIDGESLFAREKRKAEAILSLLGPAAEVAIVAAAEGTQAPVELSRDPAKVGRALADIEATCRGARMDVALERAYGLLASADHEARTVFVLGPLTAAGFPATGDKAPAPPPGIEVVTLDPAQGTALDNVAVVSLRTEPAPEVGPRGIAVIAEIANHTGHEKVQPVTLSIAGEVIARGQVTIGAGASASKRFSAVLPAGAGPVPIAVSAPGDALAVDNTRYAVAASGKRPRVLLVNGDPRTTRHEDELFYLTVALTPSDAGHGGATVTVTTPDLLASAELSSFDVVVLANVRALEADVVRRLAAHVKRGGGLLVSAGDNVDAEAYARTMAPLLPAMPATVRDIARASGGTSATAITEIAAEHPVMSAVASGDGGLLGASFRKLVLVSPSQDPGSQVLAHYASGAPALIAGRIGKGRTLFFTSTIDREWTDLPIYPAYVALVRRAIRFLAGQQAADRAIHELSCGDPAVIPALPGDARIAVEPPDGRRILLPHPEAKAEAIADKGQVTFRQTSQVGTYRVLAAGDDGQFSARPTATFTVNSDPRLADAQRLADDALLPGETAAPAAGPARERRVGISQYLAALILLLLVVEAAFLFRT